MTHEGHERKVKVSYGPIGNELDTGVVTLGLNTDYPCVARRYGMSCL